jgi:hypothetical protein
MEDKNEEDNLQWREKVYGFAEGIIPIQFINSYWIVYHYCSSSAILRLVCSACMQRSTHAILCVVYTYSVMNTVAALVSTN